MKSLSASSLALTAILSLGCFVSGSAHAGVLRTTDGAPVLTANGSPVTTEDGDATDTVNAALPAPKTSVADSAHQRVVYFGYGKTALADSDKRHLDHLAKSLRMVAKHHNESPKVSLTGFADRIGNAAFNEKLAMKRAEAVRAYLVKHGVDAKKINVRSVGKAEPKAECAADMPHAKLIECLREDRRVEITLGSVEKKAK